MATVSFQVPTAPPLIYYGKKSGDGFFGLILNLIVFAALIGLVWWFYQAMKKNSGAPKTDVAPAPKMAPPPPPPMAEAPPPAEPVGAEPSGAGAEVENP